MRCSSCNMACNTQDIRRSAALIGLLCLLSLCSQADASFPYYGTKIGALKRLHHGVSGDVYAVDSRTIFIKKFSYDGEAPAAYFYMGASNKPSNDGGVRLRDERGGNTALKHRYRNKDITLSLPDGKTLRDFKWFSVWCDEFAVNFGDVVIPNNLDFPRPQKVASLRGVHDVSSDNIVIVDAQTLLVPNFSYDGDAPDAKFWVGRGQRPTPQGLRIPDENGTENPLRRYDRKTIVLTLPGELTIFDIGHFGVWCEAFTVDFGHVTIPEGLNVPPSLKMLGISPQSKLNCEVLYDDLAFEVRWAVAGESIVIQLVAKLDENEYMSFGISPSKDRSVMVGSDVVVAWVDKSTGKGFAQDYYLDDKSQCSGKRGSCPDVNIQDNTNSVRLLNAAMVNGYSIVTYQRSLQATDRLDLPISVNGSEAIVWAIGPLNQRKETSFHSQYAKRTHLIDFGRQPTWSCPMPEGSKSTAGDSAEEEEEDERRDTLVSGYPAAIKPSSKTNVPEEEFYDKRAQALQRTSGSNRLSPSTSRPVPTPKPVKSGGAWDIPAIQCFEPEDGVFYAQMGPTGGKHGYPAITGHVGWGISWYINGLLIPELHVVRGKTYTFVVEGGNNPDIPAKYHPFYITDDPVGGYEHKLEEEKKAIRIFAGVHRSRSGQVAPIGVGRLCNWTPDVDGPPADDYQSFGAYQRTLTLKCDPGEPGVITWKPDNKTPDTVYYHCFTHRYLGWKIHVHDSCDGDRYTGAASEKHEVRVPLQEDDVVAEPSIRHETKRMRSMQAVLKQYVDNRGAIDNAIEQCQILEENPRLDPALCKVLVTELIYGRKSLNGESRPVVTVRNYRERLLEALGGETVVAEKKKDSKPRYVRVNSNLLKISEALNMLAAEEWRRKEHESIESYSDFLAAIASLEEDQFMVDMHVEDLLIFHAKQKHYWACHEYVKQKKFMLQDKGTCLVAELLRPPAGAVVLDMCAAPGMKTIHVCNVMQNNSGIIYAVEQSADRYRLLCNMTETAGCQIVQPINADALTVDSTRCPDVEYILVDPSCTGSGMQNRMSLGPDEKDVERLKKLAGLQIKMLSHAMTAFPNVKRVAYSTCSLYEEENEQVVQRCLESHPEFKLLSGKKALRNKWLRVGSSSYTKIGKNCLYSRPAEDFTDGIFIAIFEKRRDGDADDK